MNRRISDVLKPALGYVLAAAGLVWVFHDIQPGRLFADVSRIRWDLVALGIVCDILSYVCGGARWHLLLRPLGRVSILRATQAIYAGLFINELLPMRVGEPARAFLVSRWIPAPFVRVIPSMALERLFEGIWLAAGIGLTAVLVPLPANLVRSADVLGVAVLVLTAAFVLLVFRAPQMPPTPPEQGVHSGGWIRKARSAVRGLGDGFREIGLTRYTYLAFGVSLALFVFQALSFWLILVGYGFGLSFWVGAAVFLIIHFGTALPNAPANVGSYQFFCVLGLTLFGVDKTLATGFSVVVFILLTLPLLLIGSLALGRSGTTLSSLRKDLRGLTVRS
jgi:glycosyltransferase 2 family protein